jgi:hypothetical protein
MRSHLHPAIVLGEDTSKVQNPTHLDTTLVLQHHLDRHAGDAICRYHAVFSELFLDSYGRGTAACQHLQYYDRHCAEFLSLREQDFVAAARALGLHDLRIIFRHMMPNAVAPVLVSATIGIATAILTEAGLSFLGFGVPPPHATWGNILSGGKGFIFDAPWLTFVPGLAILMVVLSFNLFGEGLRDVLNPKLRER